MATVSRQSAFWAVVALGLNTFTQDGGKVLGFPAEYSRALRLSPIVCIVDTLAVLFSVAFFWWKTSSFEDGVALAARYRCLTEEERAERSLERTWWFRLSVFALGALSQAVKVLGMGGIPLTKTWGMAYLVSFLVLEGLDLLQPQQHRDDHTLETDVAIMDRYVWYAVFIQCHCFVVELFLLPSRSDIKCGLELCCYLPELGGAKNGRMVVIIESCSVLVRFAPFVFARAAYPLFFERTHTELSGDFVVMGQIGSFIPGATAHLVGLYNLFRRLSSCPPYLRFLVLMELIVVFLTSFFLVWVWYEAALQIRWSRGSLFGLKRREGFLPLLFAAWTIASIICYYMFIYDPSNTYKPPWTENLG